MALLVLERIVSTFGFTNMAILTKYGQKDYTGRFNLLKAEKQLILEGLKKTNESLKLSVMLKLQEMELLVAMVRHGITACAT
jgi:hypothetical protein